MLKLVVRILRIGLYTSASLVRQCRIEILEMSQSSGVQSIFSAISSLKFTQGLPTDRSKRALLIILGLLILLLYMWPSWLKFNRQPINLSVEDLCLNAKIQHLSNSIDSYNSVIDQKLSEDKHSYYPFVGNGYIGIGIEAIGKLYLKYQRTLSLMVNYHPVITASLHGYEDKDLSVIEVENGLVYSVQCFPVEDTCLSVTRYSYAHRTRPALFIQDIRVSNPTNTGITLNWEQVGPSDWTGAETKITSVPSRSGVELKVRITIGTVVAKVDGNDRLIGVAVASTILPETVSVDKGSSWKELVVTAVQYADLSGRNSAKELENLEGMVVQEIKSGLNVERKLLRREHSSIWRKLWKTGFSISRSLAKDALNGNHINSTMYYVMSSVRAPIHEVKDLGSHQDLEKLLYYSDRCYSGHHTLQNQKMWQAAEDINSLNLLVQTWLLTLEKQGCHNMLLAGVDGLVQAMVLSFGGLKFSNQHLEFNTEPKDLHRDYYFRRISYGNNTHLNISVIVGEDNKAQLYVTLDRNDKPYYACDAGCMDPPAKLSSEWTHFPVKLTKPMTAILYVTYDKIHMEELKHAIHVQEIDIAPAHEHHVMALHRHGHHYGGLPMLFWVCIGILIVIFHLFLFKLVINEYCDRGDKYYTRGRYNL